MDLNEDLTKASENFTCNLSGDNKCNDDSENVDDVEPLYFGPEAHGFDKSHGGEWIYPTNYPVRQYQRNIVQNALFKNTLVCLPTGLGKTFIAAVIMYNYHRWYPKNIVVFMAHSKPLVAQQIHACYNIMGIPSSVVAELNGNMSHVNRKKQWDTKKIFFLTPQVFNNDLARGNVNAKSVRCLVIDEAHKALGNQAYCQVIRSIKPFNSSFRVLALSATPGDDMNMVQEVVKNLLISHLELHREEDPDIKPYLHEKKIETVVVKLDDKILEVKDLFLRAVDKYVKPLVKNKILPQSFSSINPFALVLKQRQFCQDPNVGPELRGLMLSNFSVSISLFYALEELVIHGLRSFVTKIKGLQSGEGSSNNNHHRIANDEELKYLVSYVESYLGPDGSVALDPDASLTRIFDDIDGINTDSPVIYSHPKFAALEKIIQEHFEVHKESTRVIVFCKSRQCTGEICNFLIRFRPVVKPMIFIGQSQSKPGITAKGFNQAAQLKVMKMFRAGIFNTLIATCVAEEGLDIGEVDLIINFDSGKNSNTQVQRSGRTGRKRNGRVVNLLTEGKEQQNYKISISKGKKMNKRLVTDSSKLPFYTDNPRLIPNGINPVCQEMYLTVKKLSEEEIGAANQTLKRSRKKKLNDISKEENNKKKFKQNHADERNNLIGELHGKQIGDGCTQVELNLEKENDCNSVNMHLNDEKMDTNETKMGRQDIKINVTQKNIQTNFQEIAACSSVDVAPCDDDEVIYLSGDDRIQEPVNSPIKPKNVNISEKKLDDFPSTSKLPVGHEQNKALPVNKLRPIVNLKKFESQCLDDEDLNYLLEPKVDVECLTTQLKHLQMRLIEDKEVNSVVNERHTLQNTAKEKNVQNTDVINENLKIEDDLDFDDFLIPMDGMLSSIPNLVSSTPLRKVPGKSDRQENTILAATTSRSSKLDVNDQTKSDKKVHLPDTNFQLWDDNDFLNVKDKSHHTNANCIVEQNVSAKDDHRNASPRELTMISITQALDIIENANLVDVKNQLNVNMGNEQGSPCSPILFYSQKTKVSRSICTQDVSVLSKKSNHKPASKKRLTYADDSLVRNSKRTSNVTPFCDKFEYNLDEDGDLFAETEMALQEHLDKLELNLELNISKIEEEQIEKTINSKLAPINNILRNDLEDPGLGGNSLLNKTNDTTKKPENPLNLPTMKEQSEKINICKSKLSKTACVAKTIDNHNLTIEEYCNKNDLNNDFTELSPNLLGIEFSDFCLMRSGTRTDERCCGAGNSSQKSVNKKNELEIKSGYQVMASSKKDVSNICEKDRQSWFDCDFSLFDDDDFGYVFNGKKEGNELKKCESGPTKGPLDILDDGKKSKHANALDDIDNFQHNEDNEMSSDSDIFVWRKAKTDKTNNRSALRDITNNSGCKDANALKKNVEEADLSDGTIQAIRIVEEYEKDAKLARKIEMNERKHSESREFIDICSDDSGEYFMPSKRHRSAEESGGNDSFDSSIRFKRIRRNRKRTGKQFINDEARLSGDDQVSSDESDDGLDTYDSSFVDEREVFTQAPQVDMTAKYLQSTKNLLGVQQGAFKIPKLRKYKCLNVASQVESEDISDYEEDSFCVRGGYSFDEMSNDDLSLSENESSSLVNGGKPTCNGKGLPRKNKYKRIRKLKDSSDDDMASDNINQESTKNLPSKSRSDAMEVESEIDEWFNSPFRNEVESNNSSCADTVKPCKGCPQQVVFIASRQISETPDITTALRARWNMIVHVRSTPEADYIVSWRVGINRVILSDFASGCSKEKNALKEGIEKLLLNFQKPILIVEDDKNKGLPLTEGCHKNLWTKHSYKTVAKLVKNNIKLLFSRSKDDTARIVAQLSVQECKQGYCIDISCKEIPMAVEKKLKFCNMLPGINTANALRIIKKYPNLISVIKACDSVQSIVKEFGIKREVALKIRKILYSSPMS